MHGKALKRLGKIGLPVLVVVAGFCSSGTDAARADSWVYAKDGAVIFWGDSAQHKLDVWDSNVDRFDRVWDPVAQPELTDGGQQASAELESFFPQIAAMDNTQEDPETPALAGRLNSILIGGGVVFDNATMTALRRIKEIYDEMGGAIKALLTTNTPQIEKSLDNAVKDIKLGNLPKTVLDAARGEISPEMSFRQSQTMLIRSLTNEASRLSQQISSTTTGEAREHAMKLVAKYRANIRLATKGSARLGVLSAIAVGATIWFLEGKLGATVKSNRVLLIRDGSGVPIRTWGLCRRVVRKAGGPYLKNTVSCPIGDVPVDFQTAFQPRLPAVLAIKTGGSDDRLRMRLDPEDPAFSSTLASMGDGHDEVSGSEVDDWLIGGGGPDTILGNGGDDWLDGDIGLNPSDGGDNDRLFGGPGDDVAEGGFGADLIFGGPGDDSGNSGTALSGGPGNDVIVGGSGSDEMSGGANRDTILAQESPPEIDATVDCGPETGTVANPQYATTDPGDMPLRCNQTPASVPSLVDLAKLEPPTNGLWSWYGP